MTPNRGESTGTPDFRRHSSSAIRRRTSSAPRAPSLLHNVVDLTQEDSDKEDNDKEDNDKEEKEEDPAASETGRPRAASARMMTGRKRSRRVTSPPSEDGNEQDRSKRLRSVPARAGSVVKQDWQFPA